jgi:hypothetical protein
MKIKIPLFLSAGLAAALSSTHAAPPVANDTTIHQLADRRDIHLRVARLDPAQAAAWHQYAVETKGGRE